MHRTSNHPLKMESFTFTCAMSPEQIRKQKKYDTAVANLVLPILAVLMFVVMAFMLGIAFHAWAEDTTAVALIATFGAIIAGLPTIYLILVAIEFPGMTRDCYDIFETKTFGYDADKNQFVYTDKYRNLRFSGRDVQKWVSVEPSPRYQVEGGTTDILLLRNGEQIVLEGKFNPKIHVFLNACRYAVYLPAPKRATSTINFYKNSI